MDTDQLLTKCDEWHATTLGECVIVNDSSYSPLEAWPFINYLETGGITDGHISHLKYLTPPKDKVPSRARRKVAQGDIVYSTVRPDQRHFGIIRDLPKNLIASTGFAVLRAKPNLACTEFIYWFLTQHHVIEYLQTIAEHSTSAYPSIKPTDLQTLPLKLPPIREQRLIAYVLGTLDEKIELNRRMNETLEEMARALFKSWFVDFDPVRAKVEGRWRPRESLPGLPSHLYDLFPNRLVASELGQIPEGWEVKPLGEDFEVTMGQSPPGNTYNEIRDGLPFYQGSTDFGFRFPRRRVYCTGPTRLAQRGDSLVSVRAPVGDLNMALEQCCVGRGVASVRHRSDSRSFTYYAMQALRTSFRLFEAEGTVFGALTSKDFQAMLRVSPPDKMVAFFDAWCSPLDRHIEVNERASLLLAAQRDSLLPQLVSGELRLENWEGDNT